MEAQALPGLEQGQEGDEERQGRHGEVKARQRSTERQEAEGRESGSKEQREVGGRKHV